jgi:hypothetical protein
MLIFLFDTNSRIEKACNVVRKNVLHAIAVVVLLLLVSYRRFYYAQVSSWLWLAALVYIGANFVKLSKALDEKLNAEVKSIIADSLVQIQRKKSVDPSSPSFTLEEAEQHVNNEIAKSGRQFAASLLSNQKFMNEYHLREMPIICNYIDLLAASFIFEVGFFAMLVL